MKLYLIRHGIAAERGTYAQDGERPLVPRGQQKTAAVARRLQSLNIHFELILTSPLLRARQTADILYQAGLASTLQEYSPLAPGGSLQQWLQWLNQNRYSNLALVGHQPDLSRWATMLVWGSEAEKLILKKAGIIGLNVPSTLDLLGNCEMFLLTSPQWFL
ncbi:MAG: phosphohistidine phosphatase SixA [Jaaginema sp. PMC 1079.18]|nr:phosphohistidine phosphatase SixA [Jaaginema sp. PMC 1080.18]MEC4852306.1 phosphohistidine phosphatase SixA [Jaaginema sp. PMC 1079.18]MEC4866607.1 phosphohistidine phosphatase SixA [Jaaginema sp. PMC 1078.18]